jgi:hypothetical protein
VTPPPAAAAAAGTNCCCCSRREASLPQQPSLPRRRPLLPLLLLLMRPGAASSCGWPWAHGVHPWAPATHRQAATAVSRTHSKCATVSNRAPRVLGARPCLVTTARGLSRHSPVN